ncbi:MAG TPA: HAMP domain-containing sensor histidine kinase, partial [Cytophagaceae bacterium]
DAPILEKNLSEIDHLISLTNDLLLIARFDARTNVMVRNRMSMSDLVREVISNFEIKARAKNICINCDSESGIDIYADISLMKRVVYNLISNAIKYSGNGTRVEVKLYKTREDHFELVIRDEGIGIPGDKLPNIFERFYRVAEDRNKSIEGTGLGLSIVKSITDAHGFRISVESEINKGTVFVVSGSVFY